jgi:hypothetical protein
MCAAWLGVRHMCRVGCKQLKIKQEGQKYKLRSPATSVDDTQLPQGTHVCSACAIQTRAGAAGRVQLKQAGNRIAARRESETAEPGQLQLPPILLKKRQGYSSELLAEEAVHASLEAWVEQGAARRGRGRRRPRFRGITPPPDRQIAISREQAIQRVQRLLPPGAWDVLGRVGRAKPVKKVAREVECGRAGRGAGFEGRAVLVCEILAQV